MIRVGVLRGGTSNEYERSLQSGAYILSNLPRDRYEPVDIFIDRDGVWHMGGRPMDYDKLKHRVDVVWNALHGFYGEDGKVAQLLENLGIPYTGSRPLSSAMAMNKKLSKDSFAKLNVKTPRGIYIEHWGSDGRDEIVGVVARRAAERFSPPWLVEPISRGTGNGPIKCTTRDELSAVLFQMFDAGVPVLIEEAVFGREVSVHTMSGFRDQPTYTFIPQEKKDSQARIAPHLGEQLQKIAAAVHDGLGLGHYSKIEAIVTPKGDVFVTNVSTMPSLNEESPLHDAFSAVGSSFSEFASHYISAGLGER